MWRPGWLALGGLASTLAVALLVHAPTLASTIGADVGPPAVHAGAAADLRVMSFNLRYATAADGENRWEHRRDLLIDTIREFDPDLLGTQECLAEQAAFLRDSLPGFAFAGVGRDDGKLAGEMCALFYRADRFRQIDAGHFWLSESPEIPGSRSWDSALTRIATWVRLAVRGDSSATLLFLNTHFDHQGVEARRRSGELIAAWLRTHHDGARIVVTGDFNAPAVSEAEGPYRALAGCPAEGSPFLLDTYRARHVPGPDEGTYHAFTGATDGHRIDWILAAGGLVPLESTILRAHEEGRYPSDHFPVTAVLRPLDAADPAGAMSGATPGSGRFAEEIARFEAADRDRPPPRGGVLFVGSSSIRMWSTLERDFAGLPVINRGFGGSEYGDLRYWTERIVFPYEPRWIVLYEGDNDLESGKSPERVAADFRAFVSTVQGRLPTARIAVISIKPSRARWHLEPQVRAANALVRACCEAADGLHFIDLFTPMLGADGLPRPELFLEDGLHLNEAGYALWREHVVAALAGAHD